MRKLLPVLLLLAVIFSGCQKAESTSAAESSAESVSTADQLYIEVSALGNLDYFYDHKMGMKMVGEELGVRTEYIGPAEYDMNAMVAAFESAIAKKPNGIVVVGFEPALNSIVNKAIAEGIPVVTVDADLPDSDRLAFIGTGNFGAGKQGGDKMAEMIGEKGKVAIMLKPGQSNLEERVAGYKAAFDSYPGIELVQLVDTQSDPVIAAQAASALLQKYPDLAGIACVEAAGGSGAATAIREAGKAGEVKIIAMDRGNEVLEGIAEGVISATVAQQTALMPYYATQILFNLNNSKVAITTDNKAAGVLGIPAAVDTGTIIVDASNYKYFMR
ncbi:MULTISPECIES: substrate-binding domain-containing protein [unclassified Oceanispirochaeta]|uniref:substrate-binding domain-containing protein n=1 Tax=unclassified Oceanispirochaeta TaxID=2635722 RepID=UPI000E0968B7|nr:MULTISPECIES: substrate-binding domain-containing protein [unclassified Oceanispirochaeta]MBF9016273.1 substrate-binding domain-containing protein [Oceanispirochaeta sp. M2]NPD72736.1 sugar ABC transporter substrate-binding protein [Oceanispirochaeta sp. M1]RDG31582.1 sugar ABC transporter substrate-binding protein [Oceanispirochaeta sp. M1]